MVSLRRRPRGPNRGRKFLAPILMAALATAFTASPVAAITVGTCPANPNYHVWGHQWASGQYDGQYGHFLTQNASVPDWNSAFSLSHLYSYYGNSDPSQALTEVEVGYYEGEGTQNYSTDHYYYAWLDQGSYHEHDSTSAPTVGTTYVYEVLYSTHNYNLGTDDWNVYWNGVGTVRGTIHESSMPYGHALAGGDVQGDSSSWTEMKTRGTPSQQIIKQGFIWTNWTTAFTSTAACHSSGITYTINSSYQDFTATGQA